MEIIQELHDNFPEQVAWFYIIYGIFYFIVLVYHFFGMNNYYINKMTFALDVVVFIYTMKDIIVWLFYALLFVHQIALILLVVSLKIHPSELSTFMHVG